MVAAELRKITTTRWIWAGGGVVALIAAAQRLIVLLGADAAHALGDRAGQAHFADAAAEVSIVVLVISVLVVTSDVRHGTLVANLLANPSRTALAGAKLAMGGIVAAALGALASVTAALLVPLAARIDGVQLLLSAGEIAGLVLRGWGSLALMGVLGAGLGLIVRSQAIALVVVLAGATLAPPLIALVAPDALWWTPLYAQIPLIGGVDLMEQADAGQVPFAMAGALGVMVAWSAIAGALGTLSLARRDVA